MVFLNPIILVSDYDQTLYLNDEDMERNKENIRKFREKGNKFVIATGRSFLDFKKKVHLYNFEYDHVILNHGGTILDKNDNIIASYFIDEKIVDDIKNILQLQESIKSFCCSELESRVDFTDNNLTKIHVKYNTKEKAMDITKAIHDKFSNYVNLYRVSENTIEIISNRTNKSNAIKLLLDKLHMSKTNVYTIGDGYSDIDMIRQFKGYAMEDSVEELKKYAIEEVKSVSDLIEKIM